MPGRLFPLDAPNPGEPGFGQAGGGVVGPFYDFDSAVSGAHFTFPTVVNNSPAPNQSSGPIPSPDGYLRTSGGSELVSRAIRAPEIVRSGGIAITTRPSSARSAADV